MFCYCEAEPFCNTCYQINALYLWAHMIPSDSKIKLPKLTIPPFEGDITKWTPFWDSYDSAIHRNSSLTEINKFNYLRSLLRGTARESVAGLMLTAVNYDEAMGVLLQCCFCNQQHPSERCQTVKSPEDRKQSLMRAGRCFRCLAR